MVALVLLGYLLGMVVYLIIAHKTTEVTDHDNEGMDALMWPAALIVLALFAIINIPGYLSKVIQKLVK
jgi:uncharacterized membrane protein YphA (DoxX/SURF4 family)